MKLELEFPDAVGWVQILWSIGGVVILGIAVLGSVGVIGGGS